VIESRVVAAIRDLASRGYGIKAIARDVHVARNTVRRYLRQPIQACEQIRLTARRLNDANRKKARVLFQESVDGNAVGVHRQLTDEDVDVSIWTVRRAVADLRRERQSGHLFVSVNLGGVGSDFKEEMKLVREISVRRGRAHQDDLEVELTAHLVRLLRYKATAKNWRGLLITALNRKTDSWLKKRGIRKAREISLDQEIVSAESRTSWKERLEFPETPLEDQIALARMRQVLPSNLRRVFDALLRTRGNQTEAAKLLGIHRNSMPPLRRQIREELRRLGFEFP
jgi:predicted transcriptional regulator/DNA-directed RNA polymerase specialized sigma24 family protein